MSDLLHTLPHTDEAAAPAECAKLYPYLQGAQTTHSPFQKKYLIIAVLFILFTLGVLDGLFITALPFLASARWLIVVIKAILFSLLVFVINAYM